MTALVFSYVVQVPNGYSLFDKHQKLGKCMGEFDKGNGKLRTSLYSKYQPFVVKPLHLTPFENYPSTTRNSL